MYELTSISLRQVQKPVAVGGVFHDLLNLFL